MREDQPRDDLFQALAQLGVEDIDHRRSRDILARATRTLARRRRPSLRATSLAGFWTRVVEPVAVGALSFAFIAAAVSQTVFVLRHVQDGFLWR